MRNKKIALIIIGALILFTLNSYAETKKLREIGRNPLVKVEPGIPTAEVMKIIVERYAGDIKYGFDLVGYGDVYLAFMDQLRQSALIEKELPIGEHIMWMLFRSRGKVKAVEDLEWAGKEPLPVFSFFVEKNDRVYEFVMPKPCGNIALRKIGTGEEFIKELRELGKMEEFKEEYEEFVEKYIVPDAICAITVSPGKANIGEPITVDMSGSQNAKSMQVEVYDATGAKVAVQMLSPDNPKWQTTFDKPGEYKFKPQAFNPEGKPSENPCEAQVYINYPPTCKLFIDCLPCEHLVGLPLTVDATGSSDPDGEVVKADFEILDEAGNVLDKKTVTEKPFVWERVFDQPGAYSITVRVTDDFGAVSTPCTLGPAVTEPGMEEFRIEVVHKKLFFLLDAVPVFVQVPLHMAPGHPTPFEPNWGAYFGARAGLLYRIVPGTLDFILSGGGALNLNNKNKQPGWKNFLLANALVNLRAGPFFVGGGLGISSGTRDQVTIDGVVQPAKTADAELVVDWGVEAFDLVTSTASIFFEVRNAIGKDRPFMRYVKILGGFRWLF
ncbi:MAG: PKD domain-containing protein [Candidatus Aminicenantales bacterium]